MGIRARARRKREEEKGGREGGREGAEGEGDEESKLTIQRPVSVSFVNLFLMKIWVCEGRG